ncbi:MAG: hypothetical protein EBR81_16295, partial [Proteobacteria bacterium]|nr:hypothetical protein [Pseudomonadota bacterium]
ITVDGVVPSTTTDRVINLAGTTGGGVLDQSGADYLVYTGSVTATGAGAKTLVLQGSNTGTGQISGIIANNSSTNTTALLKQGTGQWLLSGTNTYSGGTTLAQGTLVLGNVNALGSGSLTISAGATLDVNSTFTLPAIGEVWGGSFTFLGTSSLDLSAGSVAMTADSTVTVAASTLTVGTVSGNFGLTKAGNGTLILSGTNTYSGATTVLAGTLIINGPNALPAGSSLSVSGTASVQYTNGASATMGQADTSLTQSSPLSGIGGGLRKVGSGIVVLSGSNNYTGKTVIAGGTLSVTTLNDPFVNMYSWTTVAGSAGAFGYQDGVGNAARFSNFSYMVVPDTSGNLYVADGNNCVVRKITSSGSVTTLAGLGGTSALLDGVGSAARFGRPYYLAIDFLGGMFVADQLVNSIRKLTAGGSVTTYAGASTSGSTDGLTAAARFS